MRANARSAGSNRVRARYVNKRHPRAIRIYPSTAKPSQKIRNGKISVGWVQVTVRRTCAIGELIVTGGNAPQHQKYLSARPSIY